ncbi:MAG: PilZ domain-containing protein [Planctomycetota bacterium]
MPANRSRTMEWRRCLRQIHERNGALEIAVAREYRDGEDGRHLVWRVRVLGVNNAEVIIEEPTTLGKTIRLQPAIELVAILAIGQNRWMFNTKVIGTVKHQSHDQRTISALRLTMPESVERCQRRSYYRVETTGLNLPTVDIWPLLDPKSVVVAERANELEFERADSGTPRPRGRDQKREDNEVVMPDVGPRFPALLLNIGGGGVGLRVQPQDAQSLTSHKLFWLRFGLPLELTTPICASAKLVHTHMDSTQHTYAGLAFDFSFNTAHQHFVVDQICRFIELQQRYQLQQQAATAQRLRSA